MGIARVAVAFISFCLLLGIQLVMAQGPDLSALDIYAIKQVQIREYNKRFYSQVKIIFENDSDKAIKLKNADFKVSFRDGGVNIPFGKAPLEELVIPPKAGLGSDPGQVEATLEVMIGPKNNNTVGTIIQLFNIVGNPLSSVVMVLDGIGEVGHKVDKGWVYQTGMRAELEFVPTIQREILFK